MKITVLTLSILGSLVAFLNGFTPKQLTLMDEFNENRADVREYRQSLNEFQVEKESLIMIQKPDGSEWQSQDLIQVEKKLKQLRRITPNIQIWSLSDVSMIRLVNNKMRFEHWIENDQIKPEIYEQIFRDELKSLSPLSSDHTTLRIPLKLASEFSYGDFKKLQHHLEVLGPYVFSLIGVEVIRHYITGETIQYLLVMIPLLYLVFFILKYLYYRNTWPIIFSSVILGFSSLITFLISFFLYGGFSPFLSVGLLMVFIIGTSNLIHIFSHQDFPLVSTEQDLKNILKDKYAACLMTTLSTMIAFSSNFFSEMKVFKMLGISCFVGVGLCFVLSFYALPTLMLKIGKGKLEKFRCHASSWGDFSHEMIPVKWRNLTLILFIFLPILIFGWMGIQWNFHFSQDPAQVFIKGHPYSQGMKVYKEKFTDKVRSSILIPRDQPLDPYLAYLKAEKKITKVISKNDFEKAFVDDKSETDKKRIAQFLSGLSENTHYQNQKFQRIFFFTAEKDLNSVIEKMHHHFKQAGVLVQSFENVRNKFFEHLGGSLLISFFWTAVLIFLIFQIRYRQMRITMIAMIVDIIPCVLVLITAVLCKIEFNMNLVMALSLILGLVVDDTIHYLEYYCRDAKKSAQILVPIQFTSYILMGLFGILCISRVNFFIEVSFLMVVGVTIALVYDCWVLPLLLEKFVSPSAPMNN